jgi:hypothetical protein
MLSIVSIMMGPFLMKSVTTACQTAALSLQIWFLAPMTARSILNAYSIIRRTEVRRTKGTLRETLGKGLVTGTERQWDVPHRRIL